MRRRAPEFRRPPRMRLLYWIWWLLGVFVLAGLVLFVVHHHHLEQFEPPIREKYRKLHPRLPVTVAETLLYTDPQIELPLWLVQMFKGGRRVTSWCMTSQESDPATLFRLYVDYGRHAEATNLLLEYLESFASLRPADVINRKKMSAIWFPYTTIERLWCQLEEMQSAGHMVDKCDKLKGLLRGALRSHLKQVEVDSIDVLSSVPGQQMDNSSS